MKTIVFVVICTLLSIVNADFSYEVIDDTVLRISGSGPITDFDGHTVTVPWSFLRTTGKTIVIDEGITAIGNMSFIAFENVDKVVIPSTVTRIGQSAFEHCQSLKTVTLPARLKKIEKAAFSFCKALNHITIPDSVTFIGEAAFASTNLTEVTIPESVVTIETNAFWQSNYLKRVFYQGATEISTNYVFRGIELSTVCVPPGYKGTAFCGKALTSSQKICSDFRKGFNYCYKGTYEDGIVSQTKWKNVTNLEVASSNECQRVVCVNGTGMTSENICKSGKGYTRYCNTGRCITETDQYIEVLVDAGVLPEYASEGAIEKSLIGKCTKRKCTVDSIFSYVFETNRKTGYVDRVLMYVAGDQGAIDDLVDLLSNTQFSGNCKSNPLCYVKSVHLLETHPSCPDPSCPEPSCPECPECPDPSCPECPEPSCPDPSCPECPEPSCPECPEPSCPECPECPEPSCLDTSTDNNECNCDSESEKVISRADNTAVYVFVSVVGSLSVLLIIALMTA